MAHNSCFTPPSAPNSTPVSAEHRDYRQVNSGKTTSQTDHSCALLSITALQLARSCSGWKEMQIRKYWRTFWEISVTAAAAKWLWQLAIHWKADYMAAYCNYARNSAGEMWFAAPGEIQLKKVTQQIWPDWRSRWRNWRKGVKGPQWPDETFKIVSNWQNLKVMDDWFQFCWAFWCRIFFDWETDLQSWNIAFLGVRSPNPLPKASGLGNLTIITAQSQHMAEKVKASR